MVHLKAPKSEHSPAPFDRLPPQHIEAEQSVLGGILLDNDVLHEVAVFLNVKDFYRDTHQIIYRAMLDMYDKRKAIDAITLADELILRDQFKAIGGDETLAQISNSVPHAANVKYHAQIVRQKAVSRLLIESANEILRDGYSNHFTAEALLESAQQKIFEISEDQTKGDTVEIKDVVTEAMERIALRSESQHPVTGVATGFFDLDDITGGFQPNQLVILAARPSMGKTALALNICDHAAVVNKTTVLFVSLEMGKIELAERLLCARSRVDGHTRRHRQEPRHARNVGRRWAMRTRNWGSRADLFIDDTASRTMLQIAAAMPAAS